METGKESFNEDIEPIIDLPYNIPLKRIFDDKNFDVRVFNQNGERPIVMIRYKKDVKQNKI